MKTSLVNSFFSFSSLWHIAVRRKSIYFIKLVLLLQWDAHEIDALDAHFFSLYFVISPSLTSLHCEYTAMNFRYCVDRILTDRVYRAKKNIMNVYFVISKRMRIVIASMHAWHKWVCSKKSAESNLKYSSLGVHIHMYAQTENGIANTSFHDTKLNHLKSLTLHPQNPSNDLKFQFIFWTSKYRIKCFSETFDLWMVYVSLFVIDKIFRIIFTSTN